MKELDVQSGESVRLSGRTIGRTTGKTRACLVQECMGTLVHIMWLDGHESWFCSVHLDFDPADRTWSINERSE